MGGVFLPEFFQMNTWKTLLAVMTVLNAKWGEVRSIIKHLVFFSIYFYSALKKHTEVKLKWHMAVISAHDKTFQLKGNTTE